MSVFSFANASTGLLSGRLYFGPIADLAANTPPGTIAVPGQRNPATERFDLATQAVVPHTPPAPSAEVVAEHARTTRSALLSACDWVTLRAASRAEAVPQAWADYMQALRDVPEQPGFPQTITWPVPPA